MRILSKLMLLILLMLPSGSNSARNATDKTSNYRRDAQYYKTQARLNVALIVKNIERSSGK